MSGAMVQFGQPLRRLQIPNIQTLISTPEQSGVAPIENVSIVSVIDTAKFVNHVPVEGERVLGITIDTRIPGQQIMAPGTSQEQFASQGVGRQIPRSFQEARNVLGMINPGRSGKKGNAFSQAELKKIAQNLSLPSSGSKAELANRLIQAITSFYGGQ